MDPATALLIAGAVSSAGAIYQNQQNMKNTNKWNDVQIDLANTAHQREVFDLKAAGLNPILSASGAGASVPSLGTVHQENIGQGISDGISSASKYFSDEYKANVDNLKANTEHVNLVNTAQSFENQVKSIQAETERDLALAEREATDKILGVRSVQVGDGKEIKVIDPKKRAKAIKLIKQGIRSDMKDKSNRNWRNNLDSISSAINGFVSSASKFYKK